MRRYGGKCPLDLKSQGDQTSLLQTTIDCHGSETRLADWATLAMTWLIVDLTLFIFLPLQLDAAANSRWQEGGNLGFLSMASIMGVAGGVFLCLSALRFGASSWWFLIGHAGAFVAPFVAPAGLIGFPVSSSIVIVTATTLLAVVAGFCFLPRSTGSGVQDDAILRVFGRAFYCLGDIKLGITLMIALVVALFWGTWWESWYGLKSAHHVFYTSWWFGLLLLGFGVSLVSATLRKFPWRLDQTGWIVVHLALVLILVGSFMTFWGKQEGELGFGEGEAVSQFASATETKLEVRELTTRNGGRRIRRKVWESAVTFDQDPRATQPDEHFQVHDHGLRLFELLVDRFYSDGRERLESNDSGASPRLAVFANLLAPDGSRVPIELVANDPRRVSADVAGMLHLQLMDGVSDKVAQSLRREIGPSQTGQVVVLNGDSIEVVSAPMGEVPFEIKIPGQNSSLRILRRFDTFRVGGPNRWYDAAPGNPTNPAIEYSWTAKQEPSLAFAWQPGFAVHTSQAEDDATLNVRYKVASGYPLSPGTFVVARETGGEAFWVYQGARENDRLSGFGHQGESAELAPGLTIEFAKVHEFHSETPVFERKSYRSGNQVARVQVDIGGKKNRETWLPLGLTPTNIRVGNRDFELSWSKTTVPLGFRLRLDDFRRKFYPGSSQERAFESDVTVFDSASGSGEGLMIDMNHPLRYQGWRLYQARFSTQGGERSYLNVNRDPGLQVTWPACGLLFLGLVIVFFQKPFLRQVAHGTQGISTSKNTRILAVCLVLVGAVVAVLPGVILMFALGEGGIVLLGILAIVAGLWLETRLLNGPLARRLIRSPASGEVKS